jgi:hypothetical protein
VVVLVIVSVFFIIKVLFIVAVFFKDDVLFLVIAFIVVTSIGSGQDIATPVGATFAAVDIVTRQRDLSEVPEGVVLKIYGF